MSSVERKQKPFLCENYNQDLTSGKNSAVPSSVFG